MRRSGILVASVLGLVGAGAALLRYNSPPTFSVLPSGGAGVTSIHTNLDELFSSEMVGNWFALDGDGITRGTLALSASGTPTDQSDRVCPNGPDCAAVTSQRLSSGNYYATAAADSPSGDFSCWAVFRTDSVTGVVPLVVKDATSARAFALRLQNDSLRGEVFKNNTTLTTVTGAASAIQMGGIYFAAFTYDYVSDGASVGKLYLDGAQSGSTVSTMVGPVNAVSNAYTVGLRQIGSEALTGNVFSAGCTEKVLSASTISAMSAAVHPQLQSTRGALTSTARTSARSCSTSTSVSLLPPNQPCIVGGKLNSWPSHTNLVGRSTEIEQWTAIGTPTESANAAFAPDGTKRADTIGDDDATAAEGERYTATVTSGAAYTLACWMQAGTSSAGRLALDGTSCDVALDGGWNLAACTDTAASSTSINADIYPTDSDVASTGNVNVFGCMLAAGRQPAPHCPTFASAGVTCTADVVSVSNPLTGTDWCVSAEYTGNVDGGLTSSRGAISAGTSINSVNSYALYLIGDTPTCAMTGADGGTVSQAGDVLTDEQHTLTCCSGGWLYVDGAPSPNDRSGSDVVLGSQPATMYLGNRNGSLPFAGVLSNFRACDSNVPSECGAPPGVRLDAFGDSNTALGTTTWPEQVATLMGPHWTAYNHGVGGATSAEIVTYWEAADAGSGVIPRVITVSGGTNDLKSATPPTPAEIYANLESIISAARAEGARVLVLTVLPFGGGFAASGDMQDELESLNTMIRTGDHGATVVDAYTVCGDPNDPTVINPDYDFGDHIHLNDAGRAALAEAVWEAISQ